MIRFKYIPNPDVMNLIRSTVLGYNEDYVYGFLHEGDKHNLKYLGVYIVCSVKSDGDTNIYTNPVAVIAKNDYEAIDYFAEDTDDYGYLICQASSKASNIAVYPI